MPYASYITKMVETREQAWEEVDKIFPAGYQKQEEISERAGFAVYRHPELSYHSTISDLNDKIIVETGEYGEYVTKFFIKSEMVKWFPPDELEHFAEYLAASNS